MHEHIVEITLPGWVLHFDHADALVSLEVFVVVVVGFTVVVVVVDGGLVVVVDLDLVVVVVVVDLDLVVVVVVVPARCSRSRLDVGHFTG